MARIPYLEIADAPAAYAERLKRGRPLNIYRMLAHAGPAAFGFIELGGALLRESAIDARLRELAILRVGMLSNARYEVHQHKRIARRKGLSDAKIAALEPGADDGALDEKERFVVAFTDQLVECVKAPDAMFAQARSYFSDRELAELVLTIGYYMMVCRFLENFEVDIEADHAPR